MAGHLFPSCSSIGGDECFTRCKVEEVRTGRLFGFFRLKQVGVLGRFWLGSNMIQVELACNLVLGCTEGARS